MTGQHTQNGILIRKFKPVDQASVTALEEGSRTEIPAVVPEGYFDDLNTVDSAFSGGTFLVAEVNGRVAGMGGLRADGEIVRMRVDPRFRRQGIAMRVLDGLLEHARVSKFDRVYLHTLVEQSAARALYLRAGFRETAEGALNGNAVVACEKRLD